MSQYPSPLDKKKAGGDEFTKTNLAFAEKLANNEKCQERIKDKDNTNNDCDSSKGTPDAPNG